MDLIFLQIVVAAMCEKDKAREKSTIHKMENKTLIEKKEVEKGGAQQSLHVKSCMGTRLTLLII